MAEFLNMGGYAAYVWPCYIVTFVVLIGLGLGARRTLKRQEAALENLDKFEAAPVGTRMEEPGQRPAGRNHASPLKETGE